MDYSLHWGRWKKVLEMDDFDCHKLDVGSELIFLKKCYIQSVGFDESPFKNRENIHRES